MPSENDEKEKKTATSHPLLVLLHDYHEHRRYGEIVIKIEAGKIVRYEKKEIIK